MKYLILLFSCLTACLPGLAQDQIFKKDNAKVLARINEVGRTEIKYQLFNSPDSSVKRVAVSDVALIIYQNGEHQAFATPVPAKAIDTSRVNNDKSMSARLDSLTKTKQVIFFNALQLLDGSIGVGYLREFAKHRISVYVPLAVGIATPWLSNKSSTMFRQNGYTFDHPTFTRKTIDIAASVNFHFSPNRRFTYFIGPLIGMSQYSGTYASYQYIGGYETPVNHTFVMNNYYAMANNGALFRITSHFNIMINLAIGYQRQEFLRHALDVYAYSDYYGFSMQPFFLNAIKGGLHLGYRF